MPPKAKPKYYIKYKNLKIRLPYDPCSGFCIICRRKTRSTNLFHWFFKYSNNDVKSNPFLVLKNTIEVCRHHYHIAESIRHISTIKSDMLRKYLKSMDTQTKNNIDKLLRLAQ
jgi:hypothetical protein